MKSQTTSQTTIQTNYSDDQAVGSGNQTDGSQGSALKPNESRQDRAASLVKRTVELMRDWQTYGGALDLESARIVLGSVSGMRFATSSLVRGLAERGQLPDGMQTVEYE